MLDGEYLQPLSLDPNATDQGQEQLKWNGMSIPAEHWRWSNYDNVPIVGYQGYGCERRLTKKENI